MLNLVIFASVIVKTPDLAFFKKNGMTEPLEPITFPYLTTLKIVSLSPLILLAARNNFSAHNFVAPYKLTGAAALSVLKPITFLTPSSRHA